MAEETEERKAASAAVTEVGEGVRGCENSVEEAEVEKRSAPQDRSCYQISR